MDPSSGGPIPPQGEPGGILVGQPSLDEVRGIGSGGVKGVENESAEHRPVMDLQGRDDFANARLFLVDDPGWSRMPTRRTSAGSPAADTRAGMSCGPALGTAA